MHWSLQLSLFGFSHTTRDIRRILVVRTDRLGDVVLTLPILPVLRQCFPDAYLAMLLKRYTGEIVEGNPCVNELIWYDDGKEPVPFMRMCRIIREKNFDAVIVVYPRPRLAWLMACARVPLRIGTGYRYYSFLFNRRVFEHRKSAGRHEVEYNLRLLKELGCGDDQRPEFYIHIGEREKRKIEDLLEMLGIRNNRIVVIHPGSGGSAREWPIVNFGMLAARLLSLKNVTVIVTGVRSETKKVEGVVAATAGKAIPLVDQLSVKDLAALAKTSALFISNSTGPIHIAAALGTPVIGLYPQHTAMSAKRWGPVALKKRVFVPEKPLDCDECQSMGGSVCTCMASIPVEKVYLAAIDLLGESTTIERKAGVRG